MHLGSFSGGVLQSELTYLRKPRGVGHRAGFGGRPCFDNRKVEDNY
jgi:hypothetical protein